MVVAYLVGSIPFSYLVARAHGVDLRTVGSGNLGAGNVWRNCGGRAFAITLLLDMLKGVVCAGTARWLRLPPMGVVLVGFGAMLGHTFSVYMGFKGGKAVATSGGVLATIFPQGVVAGAVTWFAAVGITRITAVGSLAATAVVVGTALVAGGRGRLEWVYTLFVCLAGVLIVYLHRGNIERLRKGEENRLQKFL